ATLSALAVSMMFLAQTETAASRNYRTMSQARYAAEAGVHELANYLMNTGYTPTGNYDASKAPVTCTGGSCAHSAGANSCTATSIATAVSATNALCGAITISGNAATDSYNSAALGGGAAWSGGSVGSGTPVTATSGGGIGTNGNLNVSGSVAIGGTLSTPRTGAGTCSN